MDKIPEARPADHLQLEAAPRTHDKDSLGQDLMAMVTADTALGSRLVHMELSEV